VPAALVAPARPSATLGKHVKNAEAGKKLKEVAR